MIAPTDGNLAAEPEWRREVSSKLRRYRARRSGSALADLQADLPFDCDFPTALESASPELHIAPQAPSRNTLGERGYGSAKFEISIPRLRAAPATENEDAAVISRFSTRPSQPSLYSVASLAERSRGALADAGLLLFSYGGMLALFSVLGGRIGLNKLDLSVAAATLALFYAQYFALFTVFGGSTPGMMICGIRVVSFDGGMPTSRQMAWRSLGYMISAGALFLGFVWALWDQDRLCLQDRLSHTYLTPNEKITAD